MSAPNLKEIEWAISELEREESSFPVYAKLANLYTVRKELLRSSPTAEAASYLEAGPPAADLDRGMEEYGGSEFLQALAGKPQSAVWAVMDELMDTLRVVNPRAYEGVMRKIGRL